jgi:hypothetical protein
MCALLFLTNKSFNIYSTIQLQNFTINFGLFLLLHFCVFGTVQSETYHDKITVIDVSLFFCSIKYIFKISFTFRVLVTITQKAYQNK